MLRLCWTSKEQIVANELKNLGVSNIFFYSKKREKVAYRKDYLIDLIKTTELEDTHFQWNVCPFNIKVIGQKEILLSLNCLTLLKPWLIFSWTIFVLVETIVGVFGRDMSQLYKHLSFFEQDDENKCKMHRWVKVVGTWHTWKNFALGGIWTNSLRANSKFGSREP